MPQFRDYFILVHHSLAAAVLAALLVPIATANENLDARAWNVVVIVNPSVTETHISRNMLRAIYSMRLHSWSEQLSTRVFALTERSKVHQAFCEQKLEIFPHQMQQVWDRLVYSGTGQAPISLSSEEEMLSRIESTPGAIGYVSAPPTSTAVKVLDVISANP